MTDPQTTGPQANEAAPAPPAGAAPDGAAIEKRRFPRLRESVEIKVRPISRERASCGEFEAMTVNISGGGLCFRSPLEMASGEFLAVEMKLPEFPTAVVALARTVFSKPVGAAFEVGIEFWWVGWGDDTAQQAIASYIKTELQQDG